MLNAQLIAGHYFVPPVPQEEWEAIVAKVEAPPPPPPPEPEPAPPLLAPLPPLPVGQLSVIRPDDWRTVQEAVSGRIQTVPNPDRNEWARADDVLRVEVRPGEITDTGGYLASRSEVCQRVEMAVGELRWYDFAVYLEPDFELATDTKWLSLTQWKGLVGGSPPIALEIRRNRFYVGGTLGPKVTGADLGEVVRGQWVRFRFGIGWHTDPTKGSLEVLRDGKVRVAKQAAQTLEVIDGKPDLVYVKQGVYRTKSWTVAHAAHFTPVAIVKA